jgi:hypothetical protein
MTNFTLHIPTKIEFGKGVLSSIGAAAAEYGKTALLVYGGGSIKKNGVYDTVKKSLESAGVEVIEHPGVKPNPILSHAEEGAALARREGVECIVAAGGGSVIDEGKSIAVGTRNDGPLWDYYTHKGTPADALPLLAVQTMPATSSEMNMISVLTNEETKEKFSCRCELIYPKIAYLDPTTTLSIPLAQTAYACTDILSHVLEGYFTSTDPFAPVQDGYVEGIAKAVIRGVERLLADPKDYEARAAVMWAGTLAWNGICNAGVEGAGIPNHMLEHPLSAVYDLPHGAGLSIVMPAWLKYKGQQIAPRLLKFGKEILGSEGLDDDRLLEEKTAQVIGEFETWLRKIGAPTSFSDAGLDTPDIGELVKQARALCGVWGVEGYSDEDIEAVYRLCG